MFSPQVYVNLFRPQEVLKKDPCLARDLDRFHQTNMFANLCEWIDTVLQKRRNVMLFKEPRHWEDSPYPTQLSSPLFKSILYLLPKCIHFINSVARRHNNQWAHMSLNAFCNKYCLCSVLNAVIKWISCDIIQSGCSHTHDLVNHCPSKRVVCLPIRFCPRLHLQQVAAILKSCLWVQAVGAIKRPDTQQHDF